MNIAIIPARGGSKRIPGKNIKSFLGKPIIAYSIEAAIDSGIFDRVIVTTDSEEIAETAIKFGAEIPFMRPENLSDDHTATAPVIEHAITQLQKDGISYEYACCIYATAPFVRPIYLMEGYQTIKSTRCTTCYSVTPYSTPIFRALKKRDDGVLEMFWPEYELSRSQDLPEAFHDAGQFYWVDVEKFLTKPQMYATDSHPVILPNHVVQDIDTIQDWERAEFMYKAIALSESEE